MSIWVVDAGPLLFLAKLERLELLERSDIICIPEAVYRETQQYDDAAAAVIAHATDSWLAARSVGNRQETRFLLEDLDIGEAEVIALAKELHADRVILDDMDARRIARRHGFHITGTVGLLLAARLRDEIPSLRIEIERLKRVGFWINATLERKVLQEAGEGDDTIQ